MGPATQPQLRPVDNCLTHYVLIRPMFRAVVLLLLFLPMLRPRDQLVCRLRQIVRWPERRPRGSFGDLKLRKPLRCSPNRGPSAVRRDRSLFSLISRAMARSEQPRAIRRKRRFAMLAQAWDSGVRGRDGPMDRFIKRLHPTRGTI